MKPLTLLLGCLCLAASFNFGLDLYQQRHFQTVVPLTAFTPSPTAEQAFDAQVTGTSDPAELRRLARAQHDKRLDRDRLIVAVLGATGRVNGVTAVRGGLLLALSLGALLVAVRTKDAPASAPRAV